MSIFNVLKFYCCFIFDFHTQFCFGFAQWNMPWNQTRWEKNLYYRIRLSKSWWMYSLWGYVVYYSFRIEFAERTGKLGWSVNCCLTCNFLKNNWFPSVIHVKLSFVCSNQHFRSHLPSTYVLRLFWEFFSPISRASVWPLGIFDIMLCAYNDLQRV